MAVQYNSENNSFVTWLSKIKSETPIAKKEISDFFAMADVQGLKLEKLSKVNDAVFDNFCKKYKVTDNELKNFLRTWDGAGDISVAFQEHLKKSSQGMTFFEKAAKKAGTVLKSFGAALGSMAAMWVISEVIGLVVTAIDDEINRVEYAQERLEEFNNTVSESKKELEDQQKWIEENGDRYEELDVLEKYFI